MNHTVLENRVSLIYAGLSAALLSIYGTAVCPYIDSLPVVSVGAVFAGGFMLHALLLLWLNHRFIAGHRPGRRAMRQFGMELSVYLLTGTGLGLFNFLVFSFPLESGGKVIVGTCAMGLFAGLDHALYRERQDYALLGSAGFAPDLQRIFPVTRKLALMFGAVMSVTAVILILILFKDTAYLLREYMGEPKTVLRAFFLDVSFVMAVMMLFGLRVLYAYSINLRLLFSHQVNVMTKVREGDLQAQVPVVSRDEFGLIAQETNQMIIGLRERAQLHEVFGKVVSPLVARQLLSSDHQQLRQGQTVQLTVLFCDIRGFTTLSESVAADGIVRFLNDYFTRMVAIVERHHGVVDKFIGDAILAVFGLEKMAGGDFGNSHEHAVRAALAMQLLDREMTLPDGKPLRHGIGLHAGQVIAGAIGSPQRFEFTVIGDTVNTASRIEGLCKELGQPIVMSEAVYQALPTKLQSQFADTGEQAIRGREQAVLVYAGPVQSALTEKTDADR